MRLVTATNHFAHRLSVPLPPFLQVFPLHAESNLLYKGNASPQNLHLHRLTPPRGPTPDMVAPVLCSLVIPSEPGSLLSHLHSREPSGQSPPPPRLVTGAGAGALQSGSIHLPFGSCFFTLVIVGVGEAPVNTSQPEVGIGPSLESARWIYWSDWSEAMLQPRI